MVNVDELDPRLEFLVVVLPDELGVRCASEVRGDTLVGLFDKNALALDAKLRFVQAEFPALQRLSVATTCFFRDVELEARPIEAHGLPDGFDVRGFECEKNAEPPKGNVVGEIGCDEGLL